jgi:hypothetical protein
MERLEVSLSANNSESLLLIEHLERSDPVFVLKESKIDNCIPDPQAAKTNFRQPGW